MEELVEIIAKALVNYPDSVKVESESKDNEVIIHLTTVPEDMGKVIGKSGKIAKAIRTLVDAASDEPGKKVRVSIDG